MRHILKNHKTSLVTIGVILAGLLVPYVSVFALDISEIPYTAPVDSSMVMTDSPAVASPAPVPTAATYPYPSGSLINDGGTIFLIRGTTKIPFSNYSAFKGLGYLDKNVIKGDTSSYSDAGYNISTANAVHPWGSWLLYKAKTYYSTKDGLIPVPDSSIITANGGDKKYVMVANKYDIAVLTSNQDLFPLDVNDLRVYSQTPPEQVMADPNLSTSAPADTLNFGNPPTDSAPLNFGTPPADSTSTSITIPTTY